jgi:hypothetical protein
MWGRLAVCGRLAIGLVGLSPQAKRISNPLQVINLPYIRHVALRYLRKCLNAHRVDEFEALQLPALG